MKIKANGSETEISENETLLAFILSKGINPAAVIVEYNSEIPDKTQWEKIILRETDNIEIVKFMGGG